MQVTPGSLPQGFCPTSLQNEFNTFAQFLTVTFPLTATAVNYGATTPAADQQALPWYRLNNDGTPDNWYVYANGMWIRPHPIPAQSPILFFYTGTFASIDTYDGGAAGAITSTAGPMWQVVGQASDVATDYGTMGGRMPVGVSADFAPGATGGEINHTLILSEITAHSHPAFGGGVFLGGIPPGGSSGNESNNPTPHPTTGTSGGNPDGTTAPHNNLPPYLAGWWLQRTGRSFYTV